MIVHLVGSLRNIDEDEFYLRRIIETIHDHGAVLAHEWPEAAVARFNEGIQVTDWTPFVQKNLDALKSADLVIIDASYYTFAQGFQMAAALEYQKPVLVVSRNDLQYKYITGFTNSILSYKTYTNKVELSKLVTSFLKKNTVHTKDLRFNIFLTRKISNYLDEKSQYTGKNRSAIIRDIIKKRSHDSRER